MANFCTNCGAKLNPSDRFCGSCGTPVPKQANDITIREDGKGGLIIDAPEGSTVTISDAPPVQK